MAVDLIQGSAINGGSTPRQSSDAGSRWRSFVEQFVAETRFDDPGQPPPRSGGTGWLRVPLPLGLYVNVYRSSSLGRIGAEVRFTGPEACDAFAELMSDAASIDREFVDGDLVPPTWNDAEVATLGLTHASPAPWDDAQEATQRAWMALAANQFVNSLRPRLERFGEDVARS